MTAAQVTYTVTEKRHHFPEIKRDTEGPKGTPQRVKRTRRPQQSGARSSPTPHTARSRTPWRESCKEEFGGHTRRVPQGAQRMRTCLSKGMSTGALPAPLTPRGGFAKSNDTESFTLANGVSTTYQFDKNNRLSNLNHSNQAEELISYAYGYDLESNMTSRNDDLYGYDPRNQLTVAYLSGLISDDHFIVDDKTLMETQLDILSQNQSETVEGIISLDHSASSLTVDYGYPYRMTSVSIVPGSATHRLTVDTMEVSTAMYNNEGYFTKLEAADISIHPETGAINIKMDEPLFARFIKIHSHYNELDEAGNPVSTFATFTVEGAESVEAWAMVSGRNEFYNYDEKGNREARMLMTGTIETEPFTNYEDSDMLKTAYDYWYKYDANGNMVEKGTQYKDFGNDIDVVDPTQSDFIHEADAEYFRYVFDLKNRLKAVWKYNPQTQGIELVSEYLYDVDGMRVKKTSKLQEVHYIFDNSGKVLEEVDIADTETTTYVFMKERHLARITAAETLYYGLDHLGTTVLMTNESGESVWIAEATPFGDNVAVVSERKDLKLKYTGKDLDEDVGLYYFNARWYDASTGRFISEDPIRDGSNWHVYVSNNPLRFIDPTGMYINPINSFQHQNSISNTNASLGNSGSMYWDKNNRPKDNSLGNFGCLLTAVVNVGNTERAKTASTYQGGLAMSARSLSGNEKYTISPDQQKNILTMTGELSLGGGKDVLMTESSIESLLNDMSGQKFDAKRYRGDSSEMQEVLKEIANMKDDGFYIIADVGGHFINVQELTKDKKGSLVLNYHDPFDNNKKSYELGSVKGFYRIEKEDQREERQRQEEERRRQEEERRRRLEEERNRNVE
jgi:RHS repeat-associated protein